MATQTFVVHNGSLDGNEELTVSLGLSEGTRLVVAAHNDHEIILRREQQVEKPTRNFEEIMAAWEALQNSFGPTIVATPEWRARAEERKRNATEALDRVYADLNSGATEIKQAEREWELADDELDFGPFLDR